MRIFHGCVCRSSRKCNMEDGRHAINKIDWKFSYLVGAFFMFMTATWRTFFGVLSKMTVLYNSSTCTMQCTYTYMRIETVHAFASIFATFAYVFFTFFISIPTLLSNHSATNDKQKKSFITNTNAIDKTEENEHPLVLYHADDMASVADKNIYYPSKMIFLLSANRIIQYVLQGI